MALPGRSGNRNPDCRAPAIGRHQRRPSDASRHCWKSQSTALRRLRALPAVLHWATVGMCGRVPHRSDTRVAGLLSMCLRWPPGVGNGPRGRQAARLDVRSEFVRGRTPRSDERPNRILQRDSGFSGLTDRRPCRDYQLNRIHWGGAIGARSFSRVSQTPSALVSTR
jgi:hypothetical protein